MSPASSSGGDWFDDAFPATASWQDGTAVGRFRLPQLGIDLAVLFPNSFRSALTAWLGGCRRRIGYARYGRSPPADRSLQPCATRIGTRTPSPVLDAYNLLAERAGCAGPAQMELFTTAADEARRRRRLAAGGIIRLPR